MKKVFTILLLLSAFALQAQEKAFLLEGQVVDQMMKPVPDVYVVNLNSHDKDISRSNGVFSLWVTPSDSLIFSHISYYRKVVKVHLLLLNPVVMLESENVDIPEIRISTDKLSDMDRAKKNLDFIETYSPPKLQRMQIDAVEPVQQIMVENNALMRSEASSVHIASFSPSESLHVLYSKFKRKNPLTNYSSTRKVVKPPVEEEKKEKNNEN